MLLSVLVTGKAGFTAGDPPGMGGMAGGTIRARVGLGLMQPADRLMAGCAACDRPDLSAFQMADVAVRGHHRRRLRQLMAGSAGCRRSVSGPMTEVAEDLLVLALQRKGMPRFLAGHNSSPEGQKRAALWHSVADGAGLDERFAGLVLVETVMASEAPGPVAMADVVRVRRPVDVH